MTRHGAFVMRTAWTAIGARPGRTLLTATGITAAALVLGVALSVAYALSTGFARAAERADLPTVVARFDARDAGDVDRVVRALPNLAATSYRDEHTNVGLATLAGDRSTGRGIVEVLRSGRRGYAIVAGRDVRDRGAEVVVERGLARAWHLALGDRLEVGDLGALRVVGVAVAPDNVAYPLAPTARVYVSGRAMLARLGAPAGAELPVDVALLWARDASRSDVLVSAARQSSFGLRSLRFLTRAGVETLIGQAAGIVVALLVAFAAVAAGLAGVLLGAGAQSEVQRALDRIGLQRALGVTPATVVAAHALRAALVAAPAAALGLTAGALVAAAPTDRLLSSLNQLPPDAATRVGLLAVVWAVTIALVVVCAALPAWRATRRSPAALLRGGDVGAPRRRRPAGPAASERRRAGGCAGRGGGLTALGMRLVAARRARFAAVVAVLGTAAGVVLLLLALASLLVRLRDDPATLGKRYELTAALPPDEVGAVRAIPGVAAAATRYSLAAVSASSLGSPLTLVAYPGDHTRFEAPPLASGRRARGPSEAEVGVGLADALGLRPGSTLAVQPGAPREARFRVVGVVRALQDEGRVAYVQPQRLEAAGAVLSGPVVIRMQPGASRASVERRLQALGATPHPVRGPTGETTDAGFLDTLATLLRVVAATVALVCLHALVSALALTARERRGAVATLRAAGADARALRRLLAGSAAAVVVPALALAILLEAFVLAPLVSRLAAGYADLPLGASGGQIALLAGGLVALAWCAAGLAGRRLVREQVTAGLREEAA